jgi:hypothetical protein
MLTDQSVELVQGPLSIWSPVDILQLRWLLTLGGAIPRKEISLELVRIFCVERRFGLG